MFQNSRLIMKASINNRSYHSLLKICRLLLVAFILFATRFPIAAQSLPQIQARFSNPVYDNGTRSYAIDVELQSLANVESLFGTNLRFFYDASKLEFNHIDGLQPGFGIIGEVPTAFKGNDESGTELFGFSAAAAYINAAIQMMDNQFPLVLNPGKWVKVCTVNFKVPGDVSDGSFCPSLIFDIKSVGRTGSFLPGSEGLLFTVKDKDPETRAESAPAYAYGLPFNWDYSPLGSSPYGKEEGQYCITIGEILSTENNGSTDHDGFVVYQNQPNPFHEKTSIKFKLPVGQEVTFLLYDPDGRELERSKLSYPAGDNEIILYKKPWMNQSGLIFYKLKTSQFDSGLFGMTVIQN